MGQVDSEVLSRPWQAQQRRKLSCFVPLHIDVHKIAIDVILLGPEICPVLNKSGEVIFLRNGRADAMTTEVAPLICPAYEVKHGVLAGQWNDNSAKIPVTDYLLAAPADQIVNLLERVQ